MPEHRIPRPDSDFSVWAGNYYAAVEAWWNDHGLDPNDLKPLKIALDAWAKAYTDHIAALAAAHSALHTKDSARAVLERQVRPITRFIQAFPETTDADRATIGIPVPSGTALPSRAPTTRPLVSIQWGRRLTHRLRLADESTPTRVGRPRGVMGAEVWMAMGGVGGGPPVGEGGYRFVALATRGVFTRTFAAGEGGGAAHYQLRWVSTRGEVGPWSEVASATVAA